MNVFIVTQGGYSGYRINSVFSTREKAEEYIKLHNFDKWDSASVEEYEIDVKPEGVPMYFVRIKKNGDIAACERRPPSNSDCNGWDWSGNFYTHVYAEDAERAVKVANERRAQYIANNEWKGR